MPRIESVARLTDDERRTITEAVAKPATETFLRSVRDELNAAKSAADTMVKSPNVERAAAVYLDDQLAQRLTLLERLPGAGELLSATQDARAIVRAVLDQLPAGESDD